MDNTKTENYTSSTAPSPAYLRNWRIIGLWLVVATMVYNILEGIVAIWSGLRAGSIALVGFGMDSYIECVAALALFWRLSVEVKGGNPESIERSEILVHRIVGCTFILLAIYVVFQAGWSLWGHIIPAESLVGIILAMVSLLVMPIVSWGKLHSAKTIGSAALRAEAKETLACSYLSFTLLLGLVAHSIAGWWWADPVAALLMVPWLLKEGLEGLREKKCCD
jgi:divalent metal cation (Fe/Co/Zn/Cd) transporter